MNEITKELLDALKSVLFVCDYRKPTGVQTSNAEFLAHAAIAKAEAILAAPQPADDGWIPWAGGECPVNGRPLVEVIFRNNVRDTDKASEYSWDHLCESGYDIIAYRVVKS